MSATVGRVFQLGTHGRGQWLADLSGGLIYTYYSRDGFTDSSGGEFGDAETEEFAGKTELKLAYQMVDASGALTLYAKGGVFHRFSYDSTYSTSNLGPPAAAVDQSFSLTTDETVGIVGGGISMSSTDGRNSGVLDFTYRGAGDSDEIVGNAQYVLQLN